MTNPTTCKPLALTGDALVGARAALRSQLIAAGVVTVRFLIEEANDGGHQAAQAAMVDRSGAVVADRDLNALAVRVLTRWVDDRVQDWNAGDGGRSQIDWAVEVDAMDHRHYDNVKFERQRVIGTGSSADSSSILADNAIAAVLLYMGSVAPTDCGGIQHLRDGLKVLVDNTRSDQIRFLTAAQRELLVEGIAGTRTRNGSEQEWVADVPPRQNSCRLLRTKNPGAAMKDESGSIRKIIQGPSGSEVAAAGELRAGGCGARGWRWCGNAGALA